MKMGNKGKVYPSTSSSSSMYSYTANREALSILKLLPAAILALLSVVSLEDREVLAYMITRSMKSPNPSLITEEKKRNKNKSNIHNSPVFDCDCFDCYTSYWFRWDSSPNRELIHQAIEAFEEHLASGEQFKRNTRGKKREKMSGRGTGKPPDVTETPAREIEADAPEINEGFVVVLPENDGPSVVAEGMVVEVVGEASGDSEAAAVVLRSSSADNNHKGLVRKVLPDVVGLLNSRLWSLWSPNF